MRAFIVLLIAAVAAAGEVGVVSNIVVLSDKVADVSSIEAWKRSFITDGMSDADKALTIWRSVAMHQYQNEPPQEFVDNQENVSDVIKLMNVYGYSFCGIAAGEILALSRACGLEARACTINSHVVTEIFHDGGWHLYDASLINYFPKADGRLASVAELCNEVSLWRKAHPELDDERKLMEFMNGDGGTRWKAQGPEILARCPTISQIERAGFYPANSHHWASTMQEYAIDPATDSAEGGSFAARFRDQPYVTGHRMNLQLRRGEKIVRTWSNEGRHVNERGGNPPTCIGGSTSEPKAVSGDLTDLRYSARLFGDLARGRVGNGRHDYAVPLADGGFRLGALQADNLATSTEAKRGPALQVKDPAVPAVLVIRMPTSYVFLDGGIAADAVVGPAGRIVVEFSANHGLDWKAVGETAASGALAMKTGDLVHRSYDYRLRFTLHGAGTGFDALTIGNLIQHSQRPLPALGQGENTLTMTSGPAQGTITLFGSMNPANAGRGLLYTDFHPRDIDQIGFRGGPELAMLADDGTGSITFPVAAPGDIERLRVGIFYRCRGQSKPGVAGWTFRASTDDGGTWHDVGVLGDTVGDKAWGTAANLAWDVPADQRGKQMLVRIDGRNAWGGMLIHNLRLDADYIEPAGGLAPVKVGYAWSEDGQAKSAVRTVEQAEERWTITCAAKPIMTSITIERE
ncbi:MAG: hypothetical protein H0X45_06070 [Planctomycetes bacterium]|nr:hypothetical protein [Planctomycetota bacterium]